MHYAIATVAGLLLAAQPAVADQSWRCTHGPLSNMLLENHRVEEKGENLSLFWGEPSTQPDVWRVSISNAAALIATKASSEWSLATRRSFRDRLSAVRDIHPTGAALSIISIDRVSGLFQLEMADSKGFLAIQERGQCLEMK